jgi:hypothetical protein
MAKPHLDANDFMEPNSVSGRRLQGIDQAAIQAQERCKGQTNWDEPYSVRERDYQTQESIHNRSSQRGSAIFKHKDMMGVPPCPPPEHHK